MDHLIDELDAIGRSRQGSVSVSSRNGERKQTLDMWILQGDSVYYADSNPLRAAGR